MKNLIKQKYLIVSAIIVCLIAFHCLSLLWIFSLFVAYIFKLRIGVTYGCQLLRNRQTKSNFCLFLIGESYKIFGEFDCYKSICDKKWIVHIWVCKYTTSKWSLLWWWITFFFLRLLRFTFVCSNENKNKVIDRKYWPQKCSTEAKVQHKKSARCWICQS